MAAAIVMPSFGMYTADGTLVSWLHPPGAAVQEGQPVLEIETDKAVQEVVAPASGLLHQVLPVGTKLQEQMVIGYVLAEGEKPPATNSVAVVSNAGRMPQTRSIPDDADNIKATPIARRLAKERGIPLKTLNATGPGGRIVEADVLAAAARAPITASANDPIRWRIRERIPLSGMRRTIIERLRQSQSTAVALTLTREVWANELTDAREHLRQKLGSSPPVDAFFIKFLALALRKRPELNAVVSGDDLFVLDEVNIGFAVAVARGLIVPVVHEADTLSIAEIGRRVRELTERSRSGKIKPAEIEGGTSTITNLGGFAVDAFTPILNPPQSSILGVGRIQSRPVSDNGIVRVLPTVWLSLTFDHRVTDGASAAQLLDVIACQITDQSGLKALIEEK
jgi:pyruvate dehydrogenase E2 component (dihydrolipoamide acetyltransferase)